MILVATFMQSNINEQDEEQTLLQIEEEKQIEMETDVPTLDCLDFDTFSKAELFYFNHKGKEPKDVHAEFAIFEKNSIDV